MTLSAEFSTKQIPNLSDKQLSDFKKEIVYTQPVDMDVLKQVDKEIAKRKIDYEQQSKSDILSVQKLQIQTLTDSSEALLNKLDKIISLLYLLLKHPKRSIIVVSAVAIVTGTVISLLTEYIPKFIMWVISLY